MCEFCENKRNITRLEDNAEISLKYCPMCGDSLTDYNEYFISMNGGQDVYWIEDLDEASDPETLGYIIEHTSAEYLKDGLPVYRAHAIGVIAGYPKFEQY